jgi:hypothetical protein
LSLIDLGNDRAQPKMSDAVSEHTIFRVKCFSLPGKKVDDLSNFKTEVGAVGDDRGAFRLAIGNVSNSAVSENFVELRVS